MKLDFQKFDKRGIKDLTDKLDGEGLTVSEVVGDNKPKRDNGYQVKSLTITLESGQKLDLKMKSDANAPYQTKLNNKILAIKDYLKPDAYVAEVVKFTKDNEPNYIKMKEKAASKQKIVVPIVKPVSTTIKEQLDTFTTTLADLQGQAEGLTAQATEMETAIAPKRTALAEINAQCDAEVAKGKALLGQIRALKDGGAAVNGVLESALGAGATGAWKDLRDLFEGFMSKMKKRGFKNFRQVFPALKAQSVEPLTDGAPVASLVTTDGDTTITIKGKGKSFTVAVDPGKKGGNPTSKLADTLQHLSDLMDGCLNRMPIMESARKEFKDIESVAKYLAKTGEITQGLANSLIASSRAGSTAIGGILKQHGVKVDNKNDVYFIMESAEECDPSVAQFCCDTSCIIRPDNTVVGPNGGELGNACEMRIDNAGNLVVDGHTILARPEADSDDYTGSDDDGDDEVLESMNSKQNKGKTLGELLKKANKDWTEETDDCYRAEIEAEISELTAAIKKHGKDFVLESTNNPYSNDNILRGLMDQAGMRVNQDGTVYLNGRKIGQIHNFTAGRNGSTIADRGRVIWTVGDKSVKE